MFVVFVVGVYLLLVVVLNVVKMNWVCEVEWWML